MMGVPRNSSRTSFSAWMPAGLLVFALTACLSSCESEGVTPNCPPDGGNCLTAPGDAYPLPPDAGTD
jgi:hypothetical protein